MTVATLPEPLRAGVYQHYKGKLYLLLGVAQHSETGEPLVVCVPLYAAPGYRLVARPLAMWSEIIDDGHGPAVPRFCFIGDQLT